MAGQVIGAGMLFIGSGCSPALTDEQKQYLTTVEADGWYPLDRLKEMLDTARAKDPNILVAAGKLWAQALIPIMNAQGITEPLDAFLAVERMYPEHHREEAVGQILITATDECAVKIEDSSVYPCIFLAGVWEGLPKAFGAYRVELAHEEGACRDNGAATCVTAVSWKMKSTGDA